MGYHKMHSRLHSYINMQYTKINKTTYLTLTLKVKKGHSDLIFIHGGWWLWYIMYIMSLSTIFQLYRGGQFY